MGQHKARLQTPEVRDGRRGLEKRSSCELLLNVPKKLWSFPPIPPMPSSAFLIRHWHMRPQATHAESSVFIYLVLCLPCLHITDLILQSSSPFHSYLAV